MTLALIDSGLVITFLIVFGYLLVALAVTKIIYEIDMWANNVRHQPTRDHKTLGNVETFVFGMFWPLSVPMLTIALPLVGLYYLVKKWIFN